VKTVRKLRKQSYQCPACEFVWTPKGIYGAGCDSSCDCSAGVFRSESLSGRMATTRSTFRRFFRNSQGASPRHGRSTVVRPSSQDDSGATSNRPLRISSRRAS
jgi:hypothetical protein